MKVESEINVKSIRKFYSDLKVEIESNREIIIDLTEVKRIDLSGAQMIIAAGKKARELKKVVRLTGVNPQLKKLLVLSGIKV